MFKDIRKYFHIIKYILPKNLKIRLYIIYVAMLLAAILEIASLGSIPIFISYIVDGSSNYNFFGTNLTTYLKSFYSDVDIIFILPWIIIFIFLIKNMYLFYVLYLEQKIIKDIKLFFVNSNFEIYQKKPYSFFIKKDSSEIMRNIFSESQTATSLISNILMFSREFSILIGITILLLLFAPAVTLVAILMLTSLGFTFYKIFNSTLKKLGKVRLTILSQVIAGINIMIGAIKDIKIYKKENFFLNNFKERTNIYESILFKLSLIQRSPRIIFEMVSILIIFLTFYLMNFYNKDVLSTLPIIGLLAVSIIRLMPAFSTMSSCVYYIKYVKESFDNVSNELIKFKKDNLEPNKTSRDYSELKNDIIKIENLKFSYSNNESISLIENVNLSIKKGEMIGIIGKSGAGKSTLINLILGLLSPSAGSINFDKKKLIQKNIFSYVPQEIYLLDATLRKNVGFGEDEKQISDEQVEDAISSAGLTSFVEKNNQGLNLIVGERGIRLSGGEKQRVGIARALYKKPDILILDEATSSLDVVTEKEIIRSINQLKNKLTIIIVSHRLSTVENCDKIFLISNGKIKDSGKLEDLKKKHPKEF
jgi:ABC-type multidrug transport system fused ATPase/permease subunit